MGQSVYREDASRGSRHRGTFVCGRVYSWAYDSPCVEAVGGGGPKNAKINVQHSPISPYLIQGLLEP